MKDFLQDIKENCKEYGSLPFWSWNGKLEEDHLRKQIGDMHNIGMNGFFMHARGGLKTEYLSDEWFNAIKVSIDEAKKLGMEAWAYDENGWPSGFAGGLLLNDEKNICKFISYEIKESFDDEALAVYLIKDNKAEKIESSVEGEKEYFCVYRNLDTSYVDTMDPMVVDKFIEITHEEYKKRLGDSFSEDMHGFFTDEPQYYRWDDGAPYSDTLPEIFKKEYGYDIFVNLPALFIDTENSDEFRYDYYLLCHKLFIKNYMEKIYNWCENNNSKLTGHACEERSLAGQMMCCGGVMPFYEFEHMPGIDFLARFLGSDMSAKQVGSVAAQLGRKKVLSEMYAACGWDMTPVDLRLVAEHMYSGGVNVMCQHLYPYSELGQRKRDYPCHYSEHLPWQSYMTKFNNYFSALGYALSRGEENPSVLVIHPMHSCYLKYKPLNRQKSVEELDREFDKLIFQLAYDAIPYHFGDEGLIKKYGSVKDGRITVGKCTYDTVIVPTLYTLDSFTVEILNKFVSSGGRICFFGSKPTRVDGRLSDLSSLDTNISYEEIKKSSPISIDGEGFKSMRTMLRESEYGKIIYIFNQSGNVERNLKLTVRDCDNLVKVDLENLEYKKIKCTKSGTDVSVLLDFYPGESYVLVERDDRSLQDDEILFDKKPIELPEKMKLINSPLNTLTLDRAKLSLDNGETFSDKQPIERIRDNLLSMRFKGRVILEFDFNVNKITDICNLALEPNNNLEIKINGEVINNNSDEFFFDKDFLCYVIKDKLHIGINTITYSFDYYQNDYVYYVMFGGANEALRNCLDFDTEIEAIYLYGDFSVITNESLFKSAHHNSYEYFGGFALDEQKDVVSCGNVVKDGYPFFAGKLSLSFDYNYSDGDATVLYLPGRYEIADIRVNGMDAAVFMFKNRVDIKDFLKDGNNCIEINIINSNRNLMGPHHFIDPEPLVAGVAEYSLEKQWTNEFCPNYRDRYSFVKFGFEE